MLLWQVRDMLLWQVRDMMVRIDNFIDISTMDKLKFRALFKFNMTLGSTGIFFSFWLGNKKKKVLGTLEQKGPFKVLSWSKLAIFLYRPLDNGHTKICSLVWGQSNLWIQRNIFLFGSGNKKRKNWGDSCKGPARVLRWSKLVNFFIDRNGLTRIYSLVWGQWHLVPEI